MHVFLQTANKSNQFLHFFIVFLQKEKGKHLLYHV